MKREISAGVVVYYKRGERIEYILLQYQAGHWDFPKGHPNEGESLEEAALREVKEETGLVVDLEEQFKESLSYFFKYPKETEVVYKTVYFFIGRAKNKHVTLSHEHIGYTWMTFNEALGQLTFENAQEVLRKVHQHLSP
jgi:8-oxo-dGTP pyrophosphatase MutT (NUDIX family)